jgi:hypothetical protein
MHSGRETFQLAVVGGWQKFVVNKSLSYSKSALAATSLPLYQWHSGTTSQALRMLLPVTHQLAASGTMSVMTNQLLHQSIHQPLDSASGCLLLQLLLLLLIHA